VTDQVSNNDLHTRLEVLKANVQHYNDDCRRDNELLRAKLEDNRKVLSDRIDSVAVDVKDIKSSVKTILMSCVLLFITAVGKWLISGGLHV